MTRNTLTYLTLQETKRANQVKERQNQQELERKERELAETMANNLRNYGINVTKNQLTKLANDQLNERESRKILETIRSNLANELLKNNQLLETTRNNKERERLEQENNDIKRMDTLLTAAKATGKTPDAILLSWFLNQANLQAFAGENAPGNLVQQFSDWLGKNTSSEVELQSVRNDGSRNPIIKGNRNSVEKAYPDTFNESSVYHGNRTRIKRYIKRDEENEIPTDFSSSRGPQSGERRYENENNFEQNQSSQEGGNGSRTIENSSNNYDRSRSDTSNERKSAVIYSGNSRTSGSNSGPGIAFS